jgi:hypothetical protein
MNKKLFLCAAVLFFMLAWRYAFGQAESAINWDPLLQEDPMQDVAAVFVAAPILGVVFGTFRLLRTNSPRPALVVLRLD